MLGGLVAAYFVARELPFLSASSPLVFRDAGIVLIAGSADLRGRGAGRPLRARRADQARRAGARGRVPRGLRRPVLLLHRRAGQPVLPRPGPACGAHRRAGRGDHQRGQHGRRTGRSGRRRGRRGRRWPSSSFSYSLTRLNGTDRATTAALLSILLAGVCAGFLVHNFHPARLFMGDSGSMLIGLVLSASAVTLSGQFTPEQLSQGGGGSAASLLPDAAPGAAADLAADRAAGRPHPGRRTPHPGRPVAVRPGQAAPAPPAARDRPQPAPGRPHHVDVGGAGRLRHRAGQPLQRSVGGRPRWAP